MVSRGLARFLALCAFFAAGCAPPPRVIGPTDAILRIPDYEEFIDETLSVMRRADFPPAQVDRVRGVTVSRPSTGGQWWEFWRDDVHGGYQILEASIATVRRVVTIRVEPQPAVGEPNEYRVNVVVEKARFSSPERQVTTASAALRIFSERLPTDEGVRVTRTRGAHWVPLGRDGLLEVALLQRLARLPGVQLCSSIPATLPPATEPAAERRPETPQPLPEPSPAAPAPVEPETIPLGPATQPTLTLPDVPGSTR